MLYRFFVVSALFRWFFSLFGWKTWPWIQLSKEDDIEITIGSWVILAFYQSHKNCQRVLRHPDAKMPSPYQAFARMTDQRDSIMTSTHQQHHHKLGQTLARVPWLKQSAEAETVFYQSLVNTDGRLDLALHEWLMQVWFGACFDLDNFVKVRQVRADLLEHLQCNFFEANYWKWPVIGPWVASQYAVPQQILQRIRGLPRKGWLAEYETETSQISAEDSAILVFLVYDFLYETSLQVVQHTLLNNTVPSDNLDWSQILPPAFFYPWRWRRVRCCSFVALNLVTSGLFWSGGPRACVGQNVAKMILREVAHLVTRPPWRLTWRADNMLQRLEGDRPLVTQDVWIKVNVLRDVSLPRRIDADTGRILYHVNSVFWNAPVMTWICQQMITLIEKSARARELQRIIIVSPEARGWILAGMLSTYFQCPLVLMRKGGKEKGTPVVHEDYKTIYSSHERLEMSSYSPLAPTSYVVCIDDGVASGGSFHAICNLLRDNFHVEPALLLAMFHHHEQSAKNGDVDEYGWVRHAAPDISTPIYTWFDTYQTEKKA